MGKEGNWGINFDDLFDKSESGDLFDDSRAEGKTNGQNQQRQAEDQERVEHTRQTPTDRVDYIPEPDQSTATDLTDQSKIPVDTTTDKQIERKGMSRRAFLFGTGALVVGGFGYYMFKKGGLHETSESFFARGLGKGAQGLANQGYEPFPADRAENEDHNWAVSINYSYPNAGYDYLDALVTADPEWRNHFNTRDKWTEGQEKRAKLFSDSVKRFIKNQYQTTDNWQFKVSEWAQSKGQPKPTADWLQRINLMYLKEEDKETLTPEEFTALTQNY